ncbi:DUF2779 domain-containing protein [Thiovibrio sp. JS02]
MAGLSKSRIQQHLQCPKRLWLSVNRPELAEEDASLAARLAAGNEVGDVARKLYPGGVFVDTLDAKQALSVTEQTLAGKPCPIFEAAFTYDGVLIRADLLFPMRSGYRMVEVKSSTSLKEYHLADAAIQSWVARKAGLPLKCIEVAHINNEFVYPGNENYDGLFSHVDVTNDAQLLDKEVPKWVIAAQKTLSSKREPSIDPGNQCTDPFACPFMGYCDPDPDGDVFPPEILPYRNGKSMAENLRAAGYEDLRKVPKGLITEPKQQRIWRVTKTGKAELDPEAGEELKVLSWPRYYLDFETIQFAVPFWAGTSPYKQIPFQWSCHIEKKNGSIEHKYFLAEDTSDPRRTFAEFLIAALGSRGPVFVYNAGFEAGRLRELARDFPPLAPKLDAIRDRFVDLLATTRNYYYHRDMRGSWSLKAVLPTIAPELSYDDLDVADGGMAQEAFLEFLHPETKEERCRKLRNDLLVYCERDTWALVKLARYFQNQKG